MERVSRLLGQHRDYELLPPARPRADWTRRRATLRTLAFLIPSLVLTAYLLSTPVPSTGTLNRPIPPKFTPAQLVENEAALLHADNNCALRTSTNLDAAGNAWESPSTPLPLAASLSSRIAAWRLASPLAPRDEWVAFNNKTCANASVRRAANKLHVREKGEPSWREHTPEKTREVREAMIGVLLDAEREGRLAVRDEERGRRGIVMTAGNADTFERVIVSLRIMRAQGNDLPVEVFHFAGEEPTSAQMFEYNKLGAKVREVEHLQKDEEEGRVKAFHIKGAALLQCDFEEFIYLDSDSIPAQDVTPLFDSPAFKEFGAIFWSDFWKDQPENAIWSILGVQCRDEWTQEAGQLVLSKAHHLDALILVAHMLSDAHWHYFFTLSDGDKDLFRYAFLALRKRWAVPGRHVASAGWLNDDDLDTKRFCGTTMVQSGLDGKPLFVHANLLKRILGTFTLGSTWGRTRRVHHPNVTTFPHLSTTAFPTPFVLSADHLANTNSQGIGLVLAPPAVRARAAVERRLGAYFHDGFRQGNYVLCVESDVALEEGADRGGGEESEVGRHSEERRAVDEEEGCAGVERIVLGEGHESAQMEWRLWEEDEVLAPFEARFYEMLGVANGVGF